MKKPVFFLLTMIICSYISFACANISDYKVMTWNLQALQHLQKVNGMSMSDSF